jgi:glycosyltransferase involved in cell wall biosynthesis
LSPPRVSIAIPTWNGAGFVGETLSTALHQTFADLEVLVVDDASEDGTLEVVAAAHDPRIRVLPGARRLGIPGNWNRCLAEARGEYVKLLCQDDLLAPTAVERLVSALDAAPGSPLAFSRREIRHEGFEAPLPLLGDTYPRALDRFYASFAGRVSGLQIVSDALASGQDPTVNLVGEPSFVLMRRDALRACGGFDAGLRQLVDWDLWLRLARLGPLAFVDESLGVFRVHPRGASAANNRRLRTRWEFLVILSRIRRDYGPDLGAEGRRRLRREEWRCRRHLLGGVLGLSSSS